jgi:hypothetical protein
VIVLKKIVFSLFLSIIYLILISEKTFAAENPTNLKTLSENLTIEIYSDGRVAPIKDANKLTEEELNKVLVEIGYSENYINNINLATKQKLVSYGGKVVEGKIADMTHEYVSNDKSYEITPYNRDKIRDIQIADLKEWIYVKFLDTKRLSFFAQQPFMDCSTSQVDCQSEKSL